MYWEFVSKSKYLFLRYIHNMKSFLLIAMSLVGSASSQVLPNALRTCSVNTDCMKYGDTAATCVTATGICTCGAGYSAYVAVADGSIVATAYQTCLKTGQVSNPNTLVEAVFSVTFPTANCATIAATRPDYLESVKKVLTGTSAVIKPPAHSCFETTYTPSPNTAVPVFPATNVPAIPPTAIPPTPVPPQQTYVPTVVTLGTGVYVSVVVTLKVKDLYTSQVINFDTRLRAQLSSTSTSYYGNSNRYLLNAAEGSASLCPNIGVATTLMAFFGLDTSTRNQCRPATCVTGWWVTEEGLCRDATHRPYPLNPATDDDLSGGLIAAIVAGSCVFGITLIIILYCCCCLVPPPTEKAKNNPDEESSSYDSSDSSLGKEH